MKRPVKVSVIIPVYNVEAYLPFAMQSCIDQTLRDVEFICVNDGSTDNSLAVLNKYAMLDDRIIIIDKPNGGVSSARNTGLKVATGKWIMFLDPDDYLETHACERVVKESESSETDIIVFGANLIPAEQKSNSWYKKNLKTRNKRYTRFSPNILFREIGAIPFVWRQAFSKNLIDKTSIEFDESIMFGEDTVFQMQIFPFAKGVTFISDRLYNYRWCREGSLMEKVGANQYKKAVEHLVIAEAIFLSWQQRNILLKYGKYLFAWFVDFFGSQALNTGKNEKSCLKADFNQFVTKYDLSKYKNKLNIRQRVTYARLVSNKQN